MIDTTKRQIKFIKESIEKLKNHITADTLTYNHDRLIIDKKIKWSFSAYKADDYDDDDADGNYITNSVDCSMSIWSEDIGEIIQEYENIDDFDKAKKNFIKKAEQCITDLEKGKTFIDRKERQTLYDVVWTLLEENKLNIGGKIGEYRISLTKPSQYLTCIIYKNGKLVTKFVSINTDIEYSKNDIMSQAGRWIAGEQC